MVAANEISISCNLKASSMFSQECVGGPKNRSLKSAWWRAERWNEYFYLSWTRRSFHYNQECTEHAFTEVNSKPAWRAARCTENAFTEVNSKLAWRAVRLQSIMHNKSAQQNMTQECNGAHYILCRSQDEEWRRWMVVPVVETSGSQEWVGGTCKVL
jgi:hypothetical protein